MTDWLQKLKDAAAGRTKGEWYPDWYTGDGCFATGPVIVAPESGPEPAIQAKKDAHFIALAANCFDELIAVVEAAANNACRHYADQAGCPTCEALSALKAKLEVV